MDATPVVSSSAADRVYAYLRDVLLNRQVQPQDVLTEGQVAEAVGVSRTPVREALLRLQAEGFVRLLPKRGALVLPVTAQETADVLEARRVLESYAVRRAAAGEDRTGLVTRLRTQLAMMRAAADGQDARGYVEADRAFHAAVVAATGNAILEALYRSLRDRQLRMGVHNLTDGSGLSRARVEATFTEHEAILAAVEAGSTAEAQAAVDAHLESAADLLLLRRVGP